MRTMLAMFFVFIAVTSGAPLSNSDRLAQLEAHVKGLEKYGNSATNKTDVSVLAAPGWDGEQFCLEWPNCLYAPSYDCC